MVNAATSPNSSIVFSFLQRPLDLDARAFEDPFDLLPLLRPGEPPAQPGLRREAIEHRADGDSFLAMLGPGGQRRPSPRRAHTFRRLSAGLGERVHARAVAVGGLDVTGLDERDHCRVDRSRARLPAPADPLLELGHDGRFDSGSLGVATVAFRRHAGAMRDRDPPRGSLRRCRSFAAVIDDFGSSGPTDSRLRRRPDGRLTLRAIRGLQPSLATGAPSSIDPPGRSPRADPGPSLETGDPRIRGNPPPILRERVLPHRHRSDCTPTCSILNP
jgi:hypothetical protein